MDSLTMRMYFGSIAIVATEVGTKVWMLKAFSVDNVENLGPAFDVEPGQRGLNRLAALGPSHETGSRKDPAWILMSKPSPDGG